MRSRRFWIGLSAGLLTIGAAAVALPMSAFANDTPRTVSGSASTTRNKDLTVTMTCPRGTTAVSVSAEISGLPGAAIDQLSPRGGKGVAHATATGSVTASWKLSAKTLCVRKTSDIEHVSTSTTMSSPSPEYPVVICPKGKEIIGLGWAVDPKARIVRIIPTFGTDSGGSTGSTGSTGHPTTGHPTTGHPTTGWPTTGWPTTGWPTTGWPTTGWPTTGYPTTGWPTTGYPTTGWPTTGYPTTGYPTTGYPVTGGTGSDGGEMPFLNGVMVGSYLPGHGRWKQTTEAVCATPGHGSVLAWDRANVTSASTTVSVSCPARKHVNALGLALSGAANEQALRRLEVSSTGVSGTLGVVNSNPNGSPSSIWVLALCTAS